MEVSIYLIPCPGPHLMPLISMFLVPGPIDMQSSPVWSVLPVIETPVDPCTWMPSVLGLWSGAIVLTFRTTTFLQLLITRWADWLLIDVKPLIRMSFAQLNVIDCINCKESHLMLRDEPLMNYGIGFFKFYFSQICLCIYIVDLVKV